MGVLTAAAGEEISYFVRRQVSQPSNQPTIQVCFWSFRAAQKRHFLRALVDERTKLPESEIWVDDRKRAKRKQKKEASLIFLRIYCHVTRFFFDPKQNSSAAAVPYSRCGFAFFFPHLFFTVAILLSFRPLSLSFSKNCVYVIFYLIFQSGTNERKPLNPSRLRRRMKKIFFFGNEATTQKRKRKKKPEAIKPILQ